eukprot:scaffold65034_cov26-Phaeocystis_antarctica.AAC.1
MPASVTPSRRCSGSAASLLSSTARHSSCAARLAACRTRLTRSMTAGSGAATSQARPPSRDESLCSLLLLPQHPMTAPP